MEEKGVPVHLAPSHRLFPLVRVHLMGSCSPTVLHRFTGPVGGHPGHPMVLPSLRAKRDRSRPRFFQQQSGQSLECASSERSGAVDYHVEGWGLESNGPGPQLPVSLLISIVALARGLSAPLLPHQQTGNKNSSQDCLKQSSCHVNVAGVALALDDECPLY